ncbi:MAG: tetratricopeptide repeat protein [Fimbriimonas sp.]|nr:tetratricopeptide repeat protein [Fimbriimonas sp.]
MSHSSTLTFMFTDIEGGTHQWDSRQDHTRVRLERHDAILHTAIDGSGGRVFKKIGSSFYAVFPDAVGAVHAALQAQTEMGGDANDRVPIRTRIAIHTGEAECRDSDYYGPPLNRVARMLTLGSGGQTLLSESTYMLAKTGLPADVSFRDLGEHRLKDLQRPEHIYQLQHAGLQETFRALRSLDALPNNLPQQVTNFIGRERELREIKKLLSGTKMLTLTGAGGTGKTRLGLEVAVDLLDATGDGSWLVEFGSVSDAGLVVQTIASTLGVREEPIRPLSETLLAFLKPKKMLLMLDNAEHLLDAISAIVTAIVDQCPTVQLLVTSREPLGLATELTYRVPSLTMPDPDRQYSQDSVVSFESVKLFVDRAILALPTFAVTSQNATAIAQLCHRLDGIPLAIELAAARVRALQVERIAERLDDRFRLLTGGSRTALPRQQTLRAMIDWSYDLLNDKERTMLRRLSVFSGGWSAAAVSSICSDDSVEPDEIGDLMQSLVDKSLAIFDGSISRFRLSETVRAYGREALVNGGESPTMRTRHLNHFGSLAVSTEDSLSSLKAVEALAMLDAEQKNLRAAIEWGLEDGDPVDAIRLANALSMFFQVRGEFTEGSTIYQSLLAKVPVSARSERATALASLGVLSFRLTLYPEARTALRESLALFLELEDDYGAAKAVNTMGVISLQLGDYEDASNSFEHALALFKAVNEPRRIAMTLNNLGILAVHHNDLSRARSLYNEALELNRRVGNRAFEAGNRTNLADLALREGDALTARTLAREACEMHLELGDRLNLQDTLEVLAPAEQILGRPRIAALLFATKEALMDELKTKVAPYVLEEYRRNVASVREVLGDEEYEAITAKGRTMTLEEVYRATLVED